MWAAGLVGLPNVGKSTLFNAITKAGAAAANYPFCTIEPNEGMVTVPDARLDALAEVVSPQRIVPTVVHIVDIAGIVKGASRGEGLGNAFLGHIRTADAIVQVVRCFEDASVIHVSGKVDPVRDAGVVELELILADIEAVERRIAKQKSRVKAKDKDALREVAALQSVLGYLLEEKSLRAISLSEEEEEWIQPLQLLSRKKLLYVANVSEADVRDPEANPHVTNLMEHARLSQTTLIPLSAQVESEIASLDLAEQPDFLREMGLAEPALDRLIRATYELLGYRTFFTSGEQEVRAWTIPEGAVAVEAAGKIHTDISRGFIAVEVVKAEELVSCGGSWARAREKGTSRLEGKQYEVQDGDVLWFRHNS